MRYLSVVVPVVCLLSVPLSSPAATIKVPGDQPTIQAGIDAASAGDTVLVASGIYTWTGEGTGDGLGLIRMRSGITLRSVAGTADCATIDGELHGRVFYLSDVDATARIEGFTITRGDAWGHFPVGRGGGLMCISSSPTLVNLDFTENVASWMGGGMMCQDGSSPCLRNCRFSQNDAPGGGGLCCESSTATLVDVIFSDNLSSGTSGGLDCEGSCVLALAGCTFSGNRSGAVYCFDSSLALANTIIAFCPDGKAVQCAGRSPSVVLTCCDIYGNKGGDWVGCIADQYGVNGNISEDPLFCDREGGDLHLDCTSPCAPAQQPDCGLIGALGVGCGSSAVVPGTWGLVKSLFGLQRGP